MLFVDIEKKIDNFRLDVCFESKDDILSLIGESGSGKSMTLKCIAGIEKPDKGRIVLNGRILFDSEKGINLPPQQRKVGYLFQEYALFPNMTVRQNIEVAMPQLPRKERLAAAEDKLKEFRLVEIADKKPQFISGGEQQRVALARIMANDPELLLLDEPFSALDSYLKWQLLLETKKVLETYKKEVIFVTHNVDEVLGMSDKLCVITRGRTETILEVEHARKSPETVSCAKLFGCRNFSKVQIDEAGGGYCVDWGIKIKNVDVADADFGDVGVKDVGAEDVWSMSQNSDEKKSLYAGIFSQDIKVYDRELEPQKTDDKAPAFCIECIISQIVRAQQGNDLVNQLVLQIDATGSFLSAIVGAQDSYFVDQKVYACILPEKVMLLNETDEKKAMTEDRYMENLGGL